VTRVTVSLHALSFSEPTVLMISYDLFRNLTHPQEKMRTRSVRIGQLYDEFKYYLANPGQFISLGG